MYKSTQCVTIPILLQVHQAEGGNLDDNSTEQLASFNHDEMNTRWRVICQRIRVDTSLDKEKQHNFGRFWSVTKMFLLGTQVKWAIALSENILWIRKGFHLARYFLVNYLISKRWK
jgi:hypothetical protein